MKFYKKLLIIYLSLILLFGILIVPMNKEMGYIHEGVYTTYEKVFSIGPIWSEKYSVEVLEGNFNRERYRLKEVNQYVHTFLIIILTLSCSTIYILHKKK